MRSTTSSSDCGARPATRSLPVCVGRATPSTSVLVAIVPPVVITTRRLMPRLFTISGRPGGGAGSDPGRLWDDGGVTDETADSARGTTTDEAAEPQPRRRLKLLVSVAAVVLALDVVTKVL